MPSNFLSPSLAAGMPGFRGFGDAPATRQRIFDSTLAAASAFEPIENQKYRLGLESVDYDGASDFSIEEQKRAIIEGKSLNRRLRGDWVLKDVLTDKEVDRRRVTLANVPYMTNNGVFIQNGTKYNLAHQMRLRPGIFTRQKESGELESHVNVSKGFGHRYHLDPKTGVFRAQFGQSNVPLLPVMRALGAKESDVRKVWGNEIFAANMKAAEDPQVLKKIVEKLKLKDVDPQDSVSVNKAISQAFSAMELDPEVMQRTLGQPFSKVNSDTVLAATQKLVNVMRGEADTDDRDSMAFQRVLGPEDILAERIKKGKSDAFKLLWKSTFPGNLQKGATHTFDKVMRGALLDTGLGAPMEEINPAEQLDQMHRVTRMGEGGIPSLEAIPDEARNVQPSHLNFIDPVHTPECHTGDAEVMTKHGWVRFDELQETHHIGCLIDGQLEFNVPDRLISETYTGLMYGMRTATTAYLVTPTHRLWTRPYDDGSPKWRFEEASYSHNRPRKFMNGGHSPYQGGCYSPQFELPAIRKGSNSQKDFEPVSIDLWCSFMGWYLSEGCSSGGYVTKISQSREASPQYCQQIEELLNTLGWTWSYAAGDFSISGKQLVDYLSRFGLCHEKYIPAELFDVPEAARRNLLDALIAGDGRKSTTLQYCSTSKRLADDVQRLCFGLGISTQVVFEPDARDQANHGGCWVVHLHKYNERIIRKKMRSPASGYYTEEFHGRVYCATVPGGLMYVRYEGKGGHWTGNSSKIGIDARISVNTRLGKDGRLYSRFQDKTGNTVWRSPQDVADSTVAFAGEMDNGENHVQAIVNGKQRYVDRQKVDYSMVSMTDTMGPLANMVPAKSAAFPQRVAMGSRFMTQALPLIDGEAPFVRSKMPEEENSFEAHYGERMGAIKSKHAGTVLDVTPTEIQIRGADRQIHKISTYNNFPYNRKTFMHSTALVQPGDRVKSGDLLAKSNFTDGKGVMALGKNVRVAYMPYKGYNYEDAIVMTESAAKRFSSEHLYQNDLDIDENTKVSKNSFLSVFPGTYDKKKLGNYDDNGLIKPGTEVHYDDPLALAVKQRTTGPKIGRRQRSFMDASIKWDHHAPGVVTDVYKGKKGVNVIVKAVQPSKIGDKFAGRYGNKGVVAAIIPDAEAPTGPDGKPYEILLNPLGIISRGNPAQVIEAMLGRVAEKTGKPIDLPDFDTSSSYIRYARQLLKKHGLSDKDDVVDPATNRKISGILAGNRFIMKLHHTAEAKSQGRATGGYTAEGTPAKGGSEGSKRIGMLDLNALLSHGAYATAQDASTVRGQRNEDYWRQVMSGYAPPKVDVPFVYRKFINELKASGINPIKTGTKTHVYALTGKDVNDMVGSRELKNTSTVDWKSGRLIPKKGGLFDETITGGHGGNRWSYIKLNEAMPNPIMEEPIRRILGLTEKQYRAVLSGQESIPGRFAPSPGEAITTGPQALSKALDAIDLDREILQARAEIANGKKTYRDAAVRRLGYLKSAKTQKSHPREWLWNKMPVLPPAFRTVSVMSSSGIPLMADPNYLYKELWDANDNLTHMRDKVSDVSEERLAVYDSMKAVVGISEPIQPQLKEQKVRGILKHVFGTSPKYGTVQRKLLGSTVDLVGRGTITPNPNLDMDEVGIPIKQAWKLYQPYVVRRLAKRGMPKVEAMQQVKANTSVAKKELLAEMSQRPVVINRAPVLHRYGMMSFWPKLTDSDTLEIPPIVTGGFAADFDGDAMNYHLPASDAAVKEAVNKLMPSSNLLSAGGFSSHYLPAHEYQGGLWLASSVKSKQPERVFKTKKDAIAAYHRGEINAGHRIVVNNT